MKKISIIIPCYNESKTIVKILEKVYEANTLGLKKEIIVVDDGSTDDTKIILNKFKKRNVFKIIAHKENIGKGAALKTGLLVSTGDIVLIQDADLEYDPKEYPLLISPILNKDVDVVYGSRFLGGQEHRVLYFWHSVMNKFLTTLSNMFTNINLTDMETCYKVFRGNLIREIAPNLQSKKFGFEPEITAKIAKIKNVKIYEVGISYFGRTYEEGKHIGWKDGVEAIYTILKHNIKK